MPSVFRSRSPIVPSKSGSPKHNRRRAAIISSEPLESRTLLTAIPTITLTASIPTASGITGASGQLTFSRSGSLAQPVKVFYHAAGTADSHQYTKLPGVITIPKNKRSVTISVTPRTGLVIAVDPVLTFATTINKAYHRGPHIAQITLNENHGTPVTNGEQFALPITVNSGSYARTDQPVDNNVNFTSAIAAASGSGGLITNSIRVVEVDGAGAVVDSNVPYQFDQASNYDATSNASGNLIIQMNGATAPNVTRHYQVQFATSGTFTAPSFTNAVSTTTGTDNVGLASYKVTNATATYVIQQSTGGISSIFDANNNDWVSFNSNSQSAGEYRGVPNLGTANGLHPYDPAGNFPASGAQNSATVTITNSGPLKTTMHVVSNDGTVDFTYEFYKNFVRATVNQNTAAAHYWFLYEGTPGGAFNTGDKLVTSDGANQTLDQNYDAPNGIGSGNTTTGQWASLQSQGENRFIYFAQNTQGTVEDSYFDLNNQMTVLGFGRQSVANGQAALESGPNTFTFGIADNNSTAATTINGQYRSVSNSIGTATAL